MSDDIEKDETDETEAKAETSEDALPDSYTLRFPVSFAGETIEKLVLKPRGSVMKDVAISTNGDGGIKVEAYKLAEVGLRLAGKARKIVDLMHPADITGLGFVTMGFITGGRETGKTSSQ